MADILSQEEIDGLLSGDTPSLRNALEKRGVPIGKSRSFPKFIAKFKGSDLPSRERRQLALAQLDNIIEGTAVSKRQRTYLRKLVRTKLAEIAASEQRERDEEANKLAEEQVEALQPQSNQRIVTNYDFKHPARVNKDQLRTLENLHDNFARLLSSTFSGAMRAVVDVDTAFVDQTTYAEFIMSLSNPSFSYQFTLGPTNGQAILDIAMPVTFAFVDRIFGGKGSSQGVEARALTPIEIGVINRITRRVIEDLEATWEPVVRVEITDIELETNPEFMQITAASEIVILLAFEVNTPNCSGLVSLCYPFFTLESILPRLGQRSYVRADRTSREELVRRNHITLAPVKIPIATEMGRAQLSLAEAENLAVGDVICMESRRTDPCVVFVGGEPKFFARPFAAETGDIRLQVVGKVPKNMETHYRR